MPIVILQIGIAVRTASPFSRSHPPIGLQLGDLTALRLDLLLLGLHLPMPGNACTGSGPNSFTHLRSTYS